MDTLNKQLEKIKTKEDFIAFLSLLLESLREHPSHWPNSDLSSYLEGMASWTEDMDGYYENNGIEFPKNVEWIVFARILMAARVYE